MTSEMPEKTELISPEYKIFEGDGSVAFINHNNNYYTAPLYLGNGLIAYDVLYSTTFQKSTIKLSTCTGCKGKLHTCSGCTMTGYTDAF